MSADAAMDPAMDPVMAAGGNNAASDNAASDNAVVTFGCRLNAWESQVIDANLDAAGARDTVVVNTCAVTAEAERQARQAIRRIRRTRPESRIVVTGCAAQTDPDTWAAMPEVDRVVGNVEKLDSGTFAPGSEAPIVVNDIMSVRETAGHLLAGFGGRAAAFLQVQQGCDHRCTFCVIPYGRGNSRSVPAGEVVRQGRQLVEAGYQEIVLSGVDISSYGDGLPGGGALGQLVRRILAALPELPRLRISSIDCIEIDPELKRLFAEEERLMPHLHLSLQSGDDLILKRMKRRHSRDQAIVLCAELRRLRPDIVFGADLIAGFPTETGAMFERTRALVEDCGLSWLHVFPYSPRPGTPAAQMPTVPVAERRERARLLRRDGEAAAQRFLESRIGCREQVLVEQNLIGQTGVCAKGKTAQFAPIALSAPAHEGAVVPAVVSGVHDGVLVGDLAGEL